MLVEGLVGLVDGDFVDDCEWAGGLFFGVARVAEGASVAHRGSGLAEVLEGVALEGVPHCGISWTRSFSDSFQTVYCWFRKAVVVVLESRWSGSSFTMLKC